MPRCPKCSSAKVKVLEEEGLSFLRCQNCGYDGLEEHSLPEGPLPERRKSHFYDQKA